MAEGTVTLRHAHGGNESPETTQAHVAPAMTPKPVSESVFDRLDSGVVSYSRSTKMTWKSGRGSQIFDSSGQSYLDFLSGCGALNYGHNDPDMKEALLSYIAGDNISMGLDFYFEAKASFLAAFETHILKPRLLDYKLHFTGPTGTNAVEAAMKIARKYTGRSNVVSFTNGYHGCTLGALTVTGNRNYRDSSHALLSAAHRLPFDGYVDGFDGSVLFEKMLDDHSSGLGNIAAVIFECVQGEGGLNVASAAWAQEIARICKERGILVIVDDVQAGCGRTGPFFSFESLGIVPDIVTLSKSISGFGLPMALTLIHPEIDVLNPGEHTGTFRGNAHACVTGAVAIEKFWKGDATERRTERLAQRISERLNAAASSVDLQRKGRGFLQGVDMGSGEAALHVQQTCIARNLLLERCGPKGEIVKALPPITITEEDLDEGLAILADAVVQTAERTRLHD